MKDSRDEQVREAIAFASSSLGPAARRTVASAAAQARILARRRAGASLEDAVLQELHRVAQDDREVADEFVAYFLDDVVLSGRGEVSPALRRFLDTGDLVQSVLGDVWGDLATIEFPSRRGFLALLRQRLRWKASARARALKAGHRREDRRDPGGVEGISAATPGDGPETIAIGRDERDRLVLVLLQLPERDQAILGQVMRGRSIEHIAADLGIETRSASRAVQRALARARRLVEKRGTIDGLEGDP